MDGGVVVVQVSGLIMLASWLFAADAAISARKGGERDAESRFLGWLANRDYDVWNDYIAFRRARETAWQKEGYRDD